MRRRHVDYPEYRVWRSMRSRCNTPSNGGYPSHGARGIRVCQRWDSFEAFLADMGPRPSPGHSIDRINSGGNYEPSNCRWVTPEVQQNNKSTNRVIVANSESLTMAQWARRLGLDRTTILYRLRRGWDAVRAVTEPKVVS